MEYKKVTFEKYIEMQERSLFTHFEKFLVEEKENFCDEIGIEELDGYFIEINGIHINFDRYEIERCDEYDEMTLYAGDEMITSLLAEDLMVIDHFREYMEKQFELWKQTI